MPPNGDLRVNKESCCLAHEAQLHQAKLRVELSQSRTEQQEYLHNVELARILKKREEKGDFHPRERTLKRRADEDSDSKRKRPKDSKLEGVLENIF